MSLLPLYDNLLMSSCENITPSLMKITSQKLNNLNESGIMEVSLLILHYLYKNCENLNLKSKLPYGIKIGASGKGLSFSLQSLPLELQRVLCEYCK